jgi:precorrin-2/cobalt-factor-2 C20-methyltransferase
MAGDQAMTVRGIFYGLGVGPGDPELITLKAWRIISQASVIAFPAANGNESLARKIAAPFIPEDAVELPIVLPMRSEREPGREAYDAACPAILAHLDQGRDVAFLCEGDPFFYGSFMYLFARITETHETIVVPGVASLTACAAAIGRPLAARNDVLKILPAPLSRERLRAEIATSESIAIMKVGQHFDKVRDVLAELGLVDKAVIIEKATCKDERITKLADVADGERSYFSTILVYKGGETW